MGLFYEDFSIGQEHATRARTITETDVVQFSGISGDYTDLHSDAEWAKTGPFGRPIAHGLLTLSIASGLTVRMNLLTDTVIAFYGIDKLRFTKPVFIGDTIRVKKRVIEMIEKGSLGVVTFETNVMNQRGELVLTYKDKLAMKKRPA